MSEIALKVEGLGKRYRIGANQEAYKTLKEKLTQTASTPFRALRSLAGRNGHHSIRKSKSETIWALKDVSFEVKHGEVVGIIGRNGAGKSTLLKILSRITDPTEGYADIHGRVGSLLEVGTGFQPELSGRENIFLNGSILGMKNADIRKKFDEIVAFAEIEKFIDTPVKHYSSGMYVRLAFAVAAHLDPEILLVDEVLAVGDAAFQKKCLGKMGDVAKQGRTILFVSHNMAAIVSLCNKTLWLGDGLVREFGNTESLVKTYLQAGIEKHGKVDVSPPPTLKDVVITKCFVLNEGSQVSAEVDFRYAFFVGLEFIVMRPIRNLEVGARLKNEYGIPILFSAHVGSGFEVTEPGSYRAWVEIPGHLLVPGRYQVDLSAEVPNITAFHYAHDCLAFDICQTGAADARAPGTGVISPNLDWSREIIEETGELTAID